MNNINTSNTDDLLFHTLTIEETLLALDTSIEGLNQEEVTRRTNIFGENELQEGKNRTVFGMFVEQFKNAMVIILIIAALISGFLGEYTDSIIILAVVVLNSIMGVVQESKAEKALAALKQMSKPFAKVKRNGEVQQINSQEVVPGDIVIIEAGDYVPADMRLIETASLKIEEAALTGESVPSDKVIKPINKPDIVVGDRKNMAYMGSSITHGRGVGIVTSTGMNTEVGKIAGYLSEQKAEETPLQKKLTEIGKYLSIGVLVISIIIFIVGVVQGREYFEMFLTSVSLAVAAIPEGLPATVTIVLAIGVQKMAKRNAIIRKLTAVEALGSTDVICSDKTGTLTLNKMTVTKIFFNGKLFNKGSIDITEDGAETLIQIMTLCNDSKLTRSDETGTNLLGDPTETALVQFALDNGYFKDDMEVKFPRFGEMPFDSERKLMSTINKFDSNIRVLTKGAPDILIDKCNRIMLDGKIVPIEDSHLESIKRANSNMAMKALRVLALAFNDFDAIPENPTSKNVEGNMVFAGLIGMIDPPRKEAKEAVITCKRAGIKPVMITGDHKDTAAAIAKELNIIDDEKQVITGSDLDKISQEDFSKQVSRYSVYARVSPEHKVRIVNAWKENGSIVAMTGDGVNDAPALKAADVGVGMGITGTDVSKGVSDMVLADDNFSTIVSAVEEGRKIYSNIRKAIQFLLSANMGEVIALFLATMFNWKILFPIHILWINLVTDAFPALALGMEKAEEDIMRQKPRKSQSGFFSGGLGANIIYQGLLQGAITLATYYIGIRLYSGEIAVTMAFVTLGLIQLAHSFNAKSASKSIFKIGFLSNKYLIGANIVSALLLVVVVIMPQLNTVFRVVHLNTVQWLIVVFMSITIVPIVELIKLFQRLNK
jgi:Ca2+-transporting ATPase